MAPLPATSAAADIRDAFARRDGPLHPEDIALLRHGGAHALDRRRAWDHVAVADGLLQAALEARRARRRCRRDRDAGDDRRRLAALRAEALASLSVAEKAARET